MKYVLGFVFSEDLSRVVLIRKQRPEWQSGMLNGLGGKVEPGERDLDAISREVHEESGVRILPETWRSAGFMGTRFHSVKNTWRCSVFTCTHPDLGKFRTVTDEKVLIAHVNNFLLDDLFLPNVRALIEACRMTLRAGDATLDEVILWYRPTI